MIAVPPSPRRARPAAGPRRALAAAALLLGLAACSAFDRTPPPPCPAVVQVPDAAELVRFNGQGRDLTDVLFEARIAGLALQCDYDDNVVESEMKVAIQAAHGPADLERQARLTYFVAIATRDRKIMAREEFDLVIPFEGNRTRMTAIEEVSPRIPLRAGESGADYVIYVGLALSPEELHYNQENR
jgi:hypothetical protein